MSYLAAAILVTAGVTYVLRTLPLLILRGEIRSRWVNDFLYYVPWAVLTAMIVPAAFTSTGSIVSAALAIAVALILAWRGHGLFTVALSAAAVVWLAEFALASVPFL